MILRLRSLTTSLLEAHLETGRGSPLKCRTKQFVNFSLVGVFLCRGWRGGLSGRRGVLDPGGGGFGVGYCGCRGLGFHDGVNLPVYFIDL